MEPSASSVPSASSAPSANGYPDHPILVRAWRGGAVESVHRGAWCLVDSAGDVLDGAGGWEEPFYVRSTIKSIQALPLVETGAAERFGLTDEELVLAMASHNGEECHTRTARSALARAGLSPEDLRCGTHPPFDRRVRADLRARGEKPTQLHNNCSGKHAGFLLLAKHLGVPLERYLDPASEGQQRVRDALAELSETPAAELVPAVDGCSAPTYRVPLQGLATAFARLANPDGLPTDRRAACRRMTAAVRAHPVLLAGSRRRLDTEIVRATDGRLYPKVGAEAVYAIGVCGADRGLAIKIDDGGTRGLEALVVALIERLGLADPGELAGLAAWRDPVLRNRAGLEVGRIETL